MTQHPASRSVSERPEFLEVALRIAVGGLTVGLLIVLPALKILGLA